MAENKESIDGIIEKLALITDASQTLFPDGKMVIVFELKLKDFKRVQTPERFCLPVCRMKKPYACSKRH